MYKCGMFSYYIYRDEKNIPLLKCRTLAINGVVGNLYQYNIVGSHTGLDQYNVDIHHTKEVSYLDTYKVVMLKEAFWCDNKHVYLRDNYYTFTYIDPTESPYFSTDKEIRKESRENLILTLFAIILSACSLKKKAIKNTLYTLTDIFSAIYKNKSIETDPDTFSLYDRLCKTFIRFPKSYLSLVICLLEISVVLTPSIPTARQIIYEKKEETLLLILENVISAIINN